MHSRPLISSVELIFDTCNRRAAFSRISFLILASITTLVLASPKDDPLFDVKREIRAEFPTVKHISVEQLRDKLSHAGKQPPLLLDVRELEEYSVSQIRGAKLTPKIEHVMAILNQQAKDRTTILYCSVGYRSAVMVKQLQQRGYKNIYNLEGSIFEWANKGYPVYQGEKPVTVVHPYNYWWGRLLDGKIHADY